MRQYTSFQPVHNLEPRNPAEVRVVIRHENGGQGHGMRGNEQVLGTDGLSGTFQFLSDAPVMWRALDRIVIVQAKRRQHLSNGRHLFVVSAAEPGAKFQFRNRDGR